MSAFRDLIDRVFNWSGGAYVGLSTLVINGMAIAEYASGTPMVVSFPDGRSQLFITHAAPQWYVGTIGIYTVILGLFWMGKPINTYVNSKTGATPPDPAAPKAGG